MSGKKFVVSGLNMMDKVVLPDGRSSWNLGGIPMYGFAGMRFWTESSEDIAFGARVGKDFMDYYGDWFNANHIDAGDLITVSDKTPYSIYVYDEQYDVEDVRFFTGDFADSRLWRPHGEDFEQWTGDETLGVYICCGPDDPCLDRLIDLKLKYGFKIMWEPNYISTFEKFRDSDGKNRYGIVQRT